MGGVRSPAPAAPPPRREASGGSGRVWHGTRAPTAHTLAEHGCHAGADGSLGASGKRGGARTRGTGAGSGGRGWRLRAPPPPPREPQRGRSGAPQPPPLEPGGAEATRIAHGSRRPPTSRLAPARRLRDLSSPHEGGGKRGSSSKVPRPGGPPAGAARPPPHQRAGREGRRASDGSGGSCPTRERRWWLASWPGVPCSAFCSARHGGVCWHTQRGWYRGGSGERAAVAASKAAAEGLWRRHQWYRRRAAPVTRPSRPQGGRPWRVRRCGHRRRHGRRHCRYVHGHRQPLPRPPPQPARLRRARPPLPPPLPLPRSAPLLMALPLAVGAGGERWVPTVGGGRCTDH